jgi:hypothetical protein
MKRVLQDERGMALALAIVALVIVGALVAGAFFSGEQEQRMAENSRYQAQSFGVAEGGAIETIGQWNRTSYNARRPYPLDSAAPIVQTQSPKKTGSYSGSIFKVTDNLYLMDFTGRDSMSRSNRLRGGGFSQRLGVLTRITPLQADIQAAFTVGGPVAWGGGNTFVQGADAPPPASANWNSCTTGAPLAGARAKAAGDIGASNGQYSGTPPSIISPTMDSSTFYNYGYTNYVALSQQASITLAPGTYSPAPVAVNGVCQTQNVTNWGDGNDHNGACGTYFPIVWLHGPTGPGSGSWNIAGGQGQGVLLVDGDVSFQGNFTFYGMIVVRGKSTTIANSTIKIYGTLLSKTADFGANSSGSGSFTVNWSSCALSQALSGTGLGALARSRSWVPLY